MAFRPESTLNPKTLRREAIQLAIVAAVSLGIYVIGVRALQIRTRPLDCEFHVPYWLGFFGHGERATLQAIDAVRRTFEGAKARAIFSDWLTG